MKKSLTIAIVLFVVCLFVGHSVACDEMKEIRKYFVTEGYNRGMGAYKNKILYLALEQVDGSVVISEWDAFNYECVLHYTEIIDGQKKYLKMGGPEIPLEWIEEHGIMVGADLSEWVYTYVPREQWKREVGRIIKVLIDNILGPLEAQRLLAIDLGFIGRIA